MTKTKNTNSRSRLDHFNVFAGLFFVLAFAVITSLSAITTMAAKPQPVKATPNLSLSPSSQTVQSGSTLTVQIWEDSGLSTINAVQANLAYPISKLNLVKIDSTSTAFGVEAQSSGGNGVINIARGSTTPLSGKQLVATLNFTPLTSTSKQRSTASVTFTTGTALLSDVTNLDILAATYGGSYSL
jgi:hypothetical protein